MGVTSSPDMTAICQEMRHGEDIAPRGSN